MSERAESGRQIWTAEVAWVGLYSMLILLLMLAWVRVQV
jgi:hypothetical protein